jgi:hypothetical protein
VSATVRRNDNTTDWCTPWNHDAIILAQHWFSYLSVKAVSSAAALYADVLIDANGQVGPCCDVYVRWPHNRRCARGWRCHRLA